MQIRSIVKHQSQNVRRKQCSWKHGIVNGSKRQATCTAGILLPTVLSSVLAS